jgi:predicted ester cyclase
MSLEKNKAIIHSLIEVFNKHNLAFDDLIAPGVVIDHTLRGLDSFKKFETDFIKAFPDYSETIEDIIAEGDKVWVRFKVMGTHTGEWNLFGITLAPTCKKITYTGVGIWRIVDGKVVERESVRDMLDFLKQLGVIEYTEKAKKLFPESAT